MGSQRRQALLGLLCFGLITVSAAGASDIDGLVRDNSACAFSLYHKLDHSKGNILISPYGISSALAMTYAAARENTASQMAGALRFTLDQKMLPLAFSKLTSELDGAVEEHNQQLCIANGLCVTGGSLDTSFTALLKRYYDAEIFHGNLDVINAWVKNKTKGNIETILEQLAANTVCVLLNAVYFKGIWETPFKKELTREMDFIVSPRKRAAADFMYRKSKVSLFVGNDFQALSLPYAGNRLSMIVVLPNAADGLPVLEKRIDADAIAQWLEKMSMREVSVFLPKFKFQTAYDLIPYFKELGMTDAFVGGVADFRGMGFKKGDLWISQIMHKAAIVVDEEGTVAAAATAVAVARHGAAFNVLTFKADHPFLFVIRDNVTGTILFLGRVADPAAGN